MTFIKPKKLQIGDTIATVSPSWGGPSIFPHVYELGLKNIEALGFKIKEFPSARKAEVDCQNKTFKLVEKIFED